MALEPGRTVVPGRPPGPWGLPLVGHLPGFLYDRLGFLTRAAERYGDVVRLRLGEITYLLSNAEDVKHVLVLRAENYDKTPRLTTPRGKRLSGSGLLTSVGEVHRTRRRQMQPAFHRSAVERFDEVMRRGVDEMIAGLPIGVPFDVTVAMRRLARGNLVRTLFGDQFDARADELGAAIDIRRRYLEHVFFRPFGDRLPSRIGRAYRGALRIIDAAIAEAIARRRSRCDGPADLLSALMRAEDDDGRVMTDAELRDEALTLLVTGHETIADALSWTWYLLALHPDARQEIEREIDGVLGDRPPSAADVRELRFATQVLNESMRLYPPTWIFIRMAKGADTLPSGATIEAGAKLYLCPWVVQRQARYFPDPARFDPGRFDDAARRARPQFAYFPFGGGVRVCIGEALARMEAVLVMAATARRLRFDLAPGQSIVLEPRMTLRARGGIRMIARRRS
jgi:cytochrome P450